MASHVLRHIGIYVLGIFIARSVCLKLWKEAFLMWAPQWLSGKESAYQCRRCWFDPWVRKIPWRGKWQPIPVFLPGKSHELRSLVGYSP